MIEQAQQDAQTSQDQSGSQPEVEEPSPEPPVVEETPSTPEIEEPAPPVVEEQPSAPDDGIPGDNTDVTHDANTDGSSVDIDVGDFVPLVASDMDESSVVSEENVFDEYGQLGEQTIESLNSSESVVETTPEPVVETAAPEPAPVVTEPVVETPAPEPAPVVTEPVVETPAPEPAPVVTEPVVETPAPEPVAETTSSNVTVELGNDIVTFDDAGNIASVEPAPVAEETNENVKTM